MIIMKKYYILFAILLAIASSCSDDFLQKDPTEKPAESAFWQRKSDFESALAGVYSYAYSWPGVLSQIQACLDGLTDNANTQYDESTYGKSKTIATGDLTPYTDGFVSTIYEDCYTIINRANTLMEHLADYKGTDMTDAEKARMTAECKAWRGYCYAWLYQCYRQVPLVTNVLTLENMYKVPKASREDILKQILTDYNDAISGLADEPYNSTSVSGHFTVGAVKALKARVLLFDAYDNSGNAVVAKMKEIVPILESITGYTLADKVRDNFISSKQAASTEIMFSCRYLAPKLTNDLDLYFGAWCVESPTRDLVDAFECTDGLSWATSPLAVHPDESVLAEKGVSRDNAVQAEREKLFQNRDSRLFQSLYHSGILAFTEYADNSDAVFTSSFTTGFNMTKLLQPTKVIPDYSTVSDADIVLVRYAHVLLMLAEAENEANGATAKALAAINKVRVRSGQPAISAGISQAQLRERIRNEWRVETCFEGLRYFQLKRWHQMDKLNGFKDPAQSTYVKVFKPAFYFFPIPQTEIDKAGGVLEQDPAYK